MTYVPNSFDKENKTFKLAFKGIDLSHNEVQYNFYNSFPISARTTYKENNDKTPNWEGISWKELEWHNYIDGSVFNSYVYSRSIHKILPEDKFYFILKNKLKNISTFLAHYTAFVELPKTELLSTQTIKIGSTSYIASNYMLLNFAVDFKSLNDYMSSTSYISADLTKLRRYYLTTANDNRYVDSNNNPIATTTFSPLLMKDYQYINNSSNSNNYTLKYYMKDLLIKPNGKTYGLHVLNDLAKKINGVGFKKLEVFGHWIGSYYFGYDFTKNASIPGYFLWDDKFKIPSSITHFTYIRETGLIKNNDSKPFVNVNVDKQIIGDEQTSEGLNIANLFASMNFNSNLDLSWLTIKNVTAISNAFNTCTTIIKIPTIIIKDNISISCESTFTGCEQLTNILSSSLQFQNSVILNASNMFNGCYNLISIPESLKNFSNTCSMAKMFNNCNSLTGINNNNLFNQQNSNFNNMFNNCNSLTYVDSSVKLPSTIQNCEGMFQNCTSLSSINLVTFFPDKLPSGVINLQNMFYGCTEITGVFPVDRFEKTGIQKSIKGCVYGCTKLSNYTSDYEDTYGKYGPPGTTYSKISDDWK